MPMLFFLFMILRGAAALAGTQDWLEPAFYSFEGREREAAFRAEFRTEMASLEELKALSAEERKVYARDRIEPTLKFLFGPLTNRSLGGPQKGMQIEIAWEAARLEAGKVVLPYAYSGIWIVDKTVPEEFPLPVPFTRANLYTDRWKSCTDSDPEHQTESFYWYFWDPERSGCDHREGTHFQTVTVHLGKESHHEETSAPEYGKLLKSGGRENSFRLSFGFGYVEDPRNPNPERDGDMGAGEYRAFLARARALLGAGFREEKILQGEYRGAPSPNKVIGRRFTGELRGTEVVVNVVMAAGVDQMQLFAKSFAHDHDGFFGWFGHSRVGSGFDAQTFGGMLARSPDYYRVSSDYQLVYWGGCNSYSYYTLPFFEFKAQVSGGADPNGTKGLDIIANGLPSYFSLNADNAAIVLGHLLRWESKPTYRMMVDELETKAATMGIRVLVAVLGDEDNQN